MKGDSPRRADGTSEDLPLITAAVFGYQQEGYIAESVSSILAQSHPNLEILVVDDGSTDRTLEVIRETVGDDPRVRVISDGANRGLVARMNQVLSMAEGIWLTVLGGDDAFLPDAIEAMIAVATPDVTVIWGDLIVMDESGHTKGYVRPGNTWQGPTARKFLTPRPPLEDLYRVNNFISGTTPMIRLEALRRVGGYTENTRNEDLDLWLRLAPDHLFRYVGRPVGRYRVVPGSSSRSERAALVDQARIFGRLAEDPRYSDKGLARLLAMRWALSVARTRGRPPASLRELALISGIPITILRGQAVPAASAPLALSAAALARQGFSRRRP